MKTTINHSRPVAEIFYEENDQSYVGLCESATIEQLRDQIEKEHVVRTESNCYGLFWRFIFGVHPVKVTPQIHCLSGVSEYRILGSLVLSNDYFCVDSTGHAGTVSEFTPDSLSCVSLESFQDEI